MESHWGINPTAQANTEVGGEVPNPRSTKNQSTYSQPLCKIAPRVCHVYAFTLIAYKAQSKTIWCRAVRRWHPRGPLTISLHPFLEQAIAAEYDENSRATDWS